MANTLQNLCPPALIYLIFSLTQIIIDMFKVIYTAFQNFCYDNIYLFIKYTM